MEGMPRFPMMSPELKLPSSSLEENHFADKINAYIFEHYGQDPDDFKTEMDELLKMRRVCTYPIPTDDIIPVMKRYYAQMLLLSKQIPLDGTHPDLQITYSWCDRIHDPSNVVSYNDVQFELANILYNIACIHAQIGMEMSRENDDGIKKAFTHFGYAAYPLQVIRDEMNGSRFATLDFDRDTLTFYLNVIMGQAQECLVEKALVESRKPLVIAKLTAHLQDLYLKCKDHLHDSPLCDMIVSSKLKEWSRMCAIKSDIYGAITMLYQGIDSEEREQFGERLAFFEASFAYVKSAIDTCGKERRQGFLETVAFVGDVVEAKYNNAKKENDFIYHARVPKPEDVKLAEPLSMACAYSFDPLDKAVSGPPLFRRLVPPTVIKAASEYDEMKANLKRGVLEKVQAYDDELDSVLGRLEWDKLISLITPKSDAEACDWFPEDLLKANSFFSIECRDCVPELLTELTRLGDRAREVDANLHSLVARIHTVGSLPQLASDEGVKAIRSELDKLIQAGEQAKKTNMGIRSAIDERIDLYHTLGLSFNELRRTLETKEAKDYASLPEGRRLLQLGEKIKEMTTQRKKLVDALSSGLLKDDVNGKLLLEKDNVHKELFEREIKKHDEMLSYIDQNVNAQGRIIAALIEANADFAEHRRKLSEDVESRSTQIVALVDAYEQFFAVKGKVDEATNFYASLSRRAEKLGGAIEGIEGAFASLKKAEDDRRMMEEQKKAVLESARAAREAMDDFAMPTVPSLPSFNPTVPTNLVQNGEGTANRRGRLGDYMAFYRQKMAASSPSCTTPLPQSPLPAPSLHLPSSYPLTHNTLFHYSSPLSLLHPSQERELPSPAPSTASNCSLSMAGPLPPHLPYHPTVTHPPPPSLPHHSLSHPPVSSYPYSLPSHPPTVSSIPTVSYQSTVPSPSYFPPPPSVHSVAPPSLTTLQYPTSLPPTVPSNAQVYGIPPSSLTPVPSAVNVSLHYQLPSVLPLPPSSVRSLPPSQLSLPPSQTALPSFPSSPLPPPSFPPQQFNRSTNLPPQPIPPSTTNVSWSAVDSGTNSATIVQSPPAVPNVQSSLAPAPSKLPSLSELSSELRGVPPPPPSSSSSFNPTVSFDASSSPWHQGLRGTPIASTVQPKWPPVAMQSSSPFTVPPSLYHPSTVTPSTQPTVLPLSMPSAVLPSQPTMAQAVAPTRQTSATIDLLSDLFSSMQSSGPSPLQPTPSVQPREEEKRMTAGMDNAVSSASSAPSSTTIITPHTDVIPLQRPAATVLPILQQPIVSNEVNNGVVRDEEPKTISYVTSIIPTQKTVENTPLPLSSLTNPSTFELGQSDEMRLSKRLIQAANRGEGDRPPLDTKDPLNQLDPFWKAK